MKTTIQDLISDLQLKFDEYHGKQLEIDNPQDPDYYLYMGKANGIGEAIDFAENYLEQEKKNIISSYEDGKDAILNDVDVEGENYFENIFKEE